MKLLQIIIFTAIMLTGVFVQAQETVHRWKRLDTPGQKIWYDEANFDSANSDHLDIWVLEQHTPPLVLDELPGTIYRSKTLYTISLQNAKYGILKVIYYDSSNKELYNFNYPIASYPDEEKYTYPILEDSFLHKIIREYFKSKGAIDN